MNREGLKRNEVACNCYKCTNLLEVGEGFGVKLTHTGDNMRYLCEACAFDTEGYGVEGFVIKGKKKKGKLEKTKVGIELEMMHYADIQKILNLRAFLIKADYIPSDDCTVDEENKSPIQEGINALSKHLAYIENQGLLPCFDTEECGAHIHGEIKNDELLLYIRRYYHTLFCPLYNYINEMPLEDRVKYFGRDFGEWADRIDYFTYPTRHANFVNTEHIGVRDNEGNHNPTLEFRLPRVRNAKQYINCVKFWREVVCILNYFNFKMDADKDTRKARAKACSDRIIKKAKKYFPY